MDWSTTPLGPLETWSNSLRTTVSLCLSSNFPINIVWGSRYNQIYNDGYRVIVAERHPAGMGMAYDECWASAWDAIGQPFERAWAGETSFIENRRMFLTRNGYLEETFFTFSLSPIRDEHGKIAGLFHPVTETTAQMLSERRTRALRELTANTSEARSLEMAFARCIQTLDAYKLDLPFVLLYRMAEDGSEARLVDFTGIAPGMAVSPRVIHISDDSPWPLAAVLNSESVFEVSKLRERYGEFDCGPYPEGANLALAGALRIPGTSAPLGIFIAGISPRSPFGHEYRQHVEQVAAAIATALGNALAYERERKRAEELAELDRVKTQFFSNISHEFRTPLTLMLGPLEDALRLSVAVPEEVRQQLDVAQRNSLRLLRLVNSLLDFSRIEAGRVKATFQPTGLASLTAELASTFRSATERAGLQLNVDCPALPEPVYVDTEMWEKIVLNLLSNAFKFTFEGRISVELKAIGREVELAVADSGTGIEERELPHLFERFHRVEGARGRTYEGTGIGLALVQELVRLHGGKIMVESAPGRGSTFRVRLPLGATHLPAGQIAASRKLASTAVGAEAFVAEALRWLPDEHPSGPLLAMERERGFRTETEHSRRSDATAEIAKVLIVDDNADMRDYVRRLPTGQYDVSIAANGEQALVLALADPPGIVIADIMMPGMDGFALLQALRANPRTRTVPVILLSARAGEEARSEGMEAGADDYLVKPFSARELLARVSAHLKLAQVRKGAEQRLKRVLETEAVGVLFFDHGGTVIDANDVFLRMTGYTRGTIERRELTWRRMTPPEWVAASEEQMRHLTETGRLGPYEKEYFLAEGTRRWMLFAGRDLGDGTISEFCIDITARKCAEEALRDSLAEREALLNELHHRVKNNLQVVTSLLEMQADQVDDSRAFELFNEARNRVVSIASIHELLYRSGAFSKVEIAVYARQLARHLVSFYRIDHRIQVAIEGDGVHMELERAVPYGLLLNELVSNVCKHAFPGERTGQLTIRLAQADGMVRMRVTDTGVGLPKGLDYRNSETLGLQLVHTLAEQLGGSVQFSSQGSGTSVEISVPREPKQGVV
jgi:PAS domain S-box-containing protein